MTKRTFFSLLYALICTVSFGQKFAHPGMLHTTSDLEFMKAKILAGKKPWKEAWSQLKSSEIASLNYKPTPFKRNAFVVHLERRRESAPRAAPEG